MHARTHTQTHTHARMHARSLARSHKRTHARTRACAHVRTRARARACTHIHTHNSQEIRETTAPHSVWNTAFEKQTEDASARQAEENAAALRFKDERIAELERTVADLGCEKEPLVTELLQALEGYNALSRAIAGVDGEDPVFFDAVGGEERGETKNGGEGGEGQALPERTLRGLKAMDKTFAELARIKALVFQLQMHVRSLV
jgi:hypothetical protein